MSKVCDTCGKGPATGNNVSHSKRHTRRRFMANIVEKRIDGTRVKLCTSCLRTSKKAPRVKNPKVRTAVASSAA
jgi:large subunit ribosomal protein L28